MAVFNVLLIPGIVVPGIILAPDNYVVLIFYLKL